MFYATSVDVEQVRLWINAEEDVSWIVKQSQTGTRYSWKLVDELDSIKDQHEYTLWHRKAGSIQVPSPGLTGTPPVVLNPRKGWTQTLEHNNAQSPWLGKGRKHEINLRFTETSPSDPNLIGRSEFYWDGNRFRVLGAAAHPDVARWWSRLKRFIQRSSIQVPWPEENPKTRLAAYVFPDAWAQCRNGKRRNPNSV